jgi:hypothetical protein
MNSKKMFLSFIPWLVFTVVVNRRGENGAGVAALLATAAATILLVKSARRGLKVIDVTGTVIFGLLAVACFAGGSDITRWVAHYGRGGAALVLAVVMLGSAVTVPFSEAYARETVPAQYWSSPVFRSTNRRISAMWGALILVMAAGHLGAGWLLAHGLATAGTQLLLNWLLPAGLVYVGIRYTMRPHGAASTPAGSGAGQLGRPRAEL